MTEQKDLSLNLSLYFPHKNDDCSLQLNLTPSSSSFTHSLRPSSWDKTVHSSDQSQNKTKDVETRSFLYDLDVNQSPSSVRDGEEYALVSSPNSTLSSISGSKRRDREDIDNGSSEELEVDRARSRGISDEEDGDLSRKKLRLSKDQSLILEESFKLHNTLNPKQKTALAKKLGLRPRQIEVWFQNRRARTKLKQTEVDCEFMKRCCENLKEENRRLLKEVQELRALKHSPQFYMQMTPPTTLTLCPSCDRVAGDRVAGSPMPPKPTQATGRVIRHNVGTIQSQAIGINPWVTNSLINHRSFNVHPHS